VQFRCPLVIAQGQLERRRPVSRPLERDGPLQGLSATRELAHSYCNISHSIKLIDWASLSLLLLLLPPLLLLLLLMLFLGLKLMAAEELMASVSKPRIGEARAWSKFIK